MTMDFSPETLDKDNHIYIDHMAIDESQMILFGTARRAAFINREIWYWCISISHENDAT